MDKEFPGHNVICHAVERAEVMAYLEVVLVVRLDGDEQIIDSILEAMDEMPRAA